MNSKLATAILALLAIPLGYLAVVQSRDRDLSSIFGAPPRKAGDTLYQFNPGEVARLNITSNAGETATFEKKFGVWYMRSPQKDRADYRTLQILSMAAAGMRIEASLDPDEIPSDKLGLGAGSYTVQLIDGQGNRLANYQVGRRSVWHRLNAEKETVHESVFIKPLDLADDHIYVCSGINVRTILDAGFVALRDRHPFLFSKAHLSDIEVRRNGGLVHLNRKTHLSPWRIIKPLELRTDPAAISSLIDQLYNFEAIKVTNPEEVTVTPSETNDAWVSLSLRQFDLAGNPSDNVQTLRVEAPLGPDATSTLGTVDERSGYAVFELPLASAEGITSFNQLPLEVNALRGKTLLGRDFRSCLSFEVHAENLTFPLFFKRALDQRSGQQRWLYSRKDSLQPANEPMIKKLRTALELDKVLGFASDATSPADLATFGLAEPSKRVLLRFGPDDEVDLLLGRASKVVTDQNGDRTRQEHFYAMRAGSNSVVEIDAGTYTGVTATVHEWRDSLLWNLSIVDLERISIRRSNTAPLTVTYDDLLEEWTVRREGEDLTALLNRGKARKFIDFLESLRVERWLGPEAPSARAALESPVYALDIHSRLVNDFGEEVGSKSQTLTIARASDARNNQYYFGQLSGDPDYFRFDRFAAAWFASDLLEEEE